MVKNPRAIKKEVINFFKQMYFVDNSVCLKHNGVGLPKLSSEQSEDLEIIPLREEIKKKGCMEL